MVERFSPCEAMPSGMIRNGIGKWVRYSDYAELEDAIETAYGILWRGYSSTAAFDARKVLLKVLDKDGQKRGIDAAISRYGPTTEREIIAATEAQHTDDKATALSRTGAAKVEGPAIKEFRRIFHTTRFTDDVRYQPELIAAVLDEISSLSPLEPAAPEGRQDDEPVAHAYVVNGECEQIEWGVDIDLPDDPALVLLYTRPAEQAVTEAMELARAVLAQFITAGHNAPGPTLEDIEKAFWALDAAQEGRHTRVFPSYLSLYRSNLIRPNHKGEFIAGEHFPEESVKTSRFGHHPDPVIDYEVEVGALEAELIDLKAGLGHAMTNEEFEERLSNALDFNVVTPEGVRAKNYLREKVETPWRLFTAEIEKRAMAQYLDTPPNKEILKRVFSGPAVPEGQTPLDELLLALKEWVGAMEDGTPSIIGSENLYRKAKAFLKDQ